MKISVIMSSKLSYYDGCSSNRDDKFIKYI